MHPPQERHFPDAAWKTKKVRVQENKGNVTDNEDNNEALMTLHRSLRLRYKR